MKSHAGSSANSVTFFFSFLNHIQVGEEKSLHLLDLITSATADKHVWSYANHAWEQERFFFSLFARWICLLVDN